MFTFQFPEKTVRSSLTSSSCPSKPKGRSGVKTFITSIVTLSVLLLAGCSDGAPMSESDQAAKYGITVQQFREEKKAAARMNMNLEEHMKMLKSEGGMKMDMGM